MFHAFIHWFNVEYWSVSWPNIWAPSFWTMLGIGLADLRNHRRHQKSGDDRTRDIAALAGQIEALSDSLRALTGGNDDNE